MNGLFDINQLGRCELRAGKKLKKMIHKQKRSHSSTLFMVFVAAIMGVDCGVYEGKELLVGTYYENTVRICY